LKIEKMSKNESLMVNDTKPWMWIWFKKTYNS